MYIAFEGADGTGKTSMAMALVEQLNSQGRNAKFVRAPGSTSFGNYLRANIHHRDDVKVYQFLANHVEIVEEVVKPHLEQGGIVVQDRTFISSIVYSGYCGTLDANDLAMYYRKAISKKPDVLFVLDCDTETCLSRLIDLDKDMDDPDVDLMSNILAAYRIEGRVQSGKIIDSSAPFEEVLETCLTYC